MSRDYKATSIARCRAHNASRAVAPTGVKAAIQKGSNGAVHRAFGNLLRTRVPFWQMMVWRKTVQNIYTVVSWLSDNRLAAAAFFFGGAAVAVMVYTYFVDYRLLPEQE
jgi:hypothetical protein